MKVKVIKLGDKNFEEEKIKMFSPKTLTKEKQLRLVFKRMIANFLNSDYDIDNYYNSEDYYIDVLVKNLIKEVTIRVKL